MTALTYTRTKLISLCYGIIPQFSQNKELHRFLLFSVMNKRQDAESVFWPVFSRKLKHKMAKKNTGQCLLDIKLSLYARNQQFLSKVKNHPKSHLA